MTREEIHTGSMVDLLARITRERTEAEEAASKQPEVAAAPFEGGSR